jgi:uncharacterized membrane protein
MNNYVKLLILILVSLSLIIVFINGDIGRSYSIDQATIDLFIENNTELHVKESLHYSFKGTYNGIYRDIPLKQGESLENIDVITEGAYSNYELIYDPYDEGKSLKQIKIYLYSDVAKTKPITDKNVTIYIDYDFKNVININEENGNLVYNLWGDQWEVELKELNAAIHLNSKNNINYTFNSQEHVKNIYWEETTLKVDGSRIPTNNYIQINMTFPLDNSLAKDITNTLNSDNSENSNINNEHDNATIIEYSQENLVSEIDPLVFVQLLYEGLLRNENQEYENNNEVNYFLNMWIIIVITTLMIPLATYIKYGNPSFNYKKKYETVIPSSDSPAIINSLFGKGFKKVGEINNDGFQATVLDLINKKYLKANFVKFDEKEKTHNFNNKSNRKILLKINRKRVFSNKAKLKKYEKNVLRCLHSIEKKGIIDFENTKEMLNKRTKAKIFKTNYNEWGKNLKKEYFSNGGLDRYYNKQSSEILKKYGISVMILTGFTFVFFIFQMNFQIILINSLIFILGFILLITPSKNLGGWTNEGKILKNKWDKFKKCINNKHMLKKHHTMPSSYWDQYLTYGTALGLSNSLNKSFKEFPSEIFDNMSLSIFSSHPMTIAMNELIYYGLHSDSTYSAYRDGYGGNDGDGSSGGSGSGGGGAGGGSGGGGGGAF